jgi:hypothetical protein
MRRAVGIYAAYTAATGSRFKPIPEDFHKVA